MMIFQPDRFLLQQFVAKHAKEFNGNVLDVGGGTRRYAKLFVHCNYTILDADESSKPNIVASADSIPLGDASMDGIVCTQVLGDVWDVQKALSEMKRVLKPGGLMLITESLMNEEHDEPRDFWRFTRFTWQKLLSEGFEIIEMAPRGGYRTARAQLAIRHRIEKWKLYEHPLLGRLFNLWATLIGKIEMARDRRDTSAAGRKFTIGYCILARKNMSS